jgi:hypothetical protein
MEGILTLLSSYDAIILFIPFSQYALSTAVSKSFCGAQVPIQHRSGGIIPYESG